MTNIAQEDLIRSVADAQGITGARHRAGPRYV